MCYAQPRPAPTVRVAVYDFVEPDGYRTHLVGRRAAETVCLLLSERGRWEVVSRPALLRQCAVEGAVAPYAIAYVQMFGHRLQAPLALCGAVRSCVVNPARGTVQVTLVGELIETLDGGGLQSVTTVGSSARGRGETVALDELVDRAIAEAAADLVAALHNFDPVTAPVMADVTEGKLILDAGRKVGLTPRAKMLAYRRQGENWSFVAVLQVQSVMEDLAHATLLASDEGIRPNDVAVLVAR